LYSDNKTTFANATASGTLRERPLTYLAINKLAMSNNFVSASKYILGSALLATAGFIASVNPAVAQSSYQNCPPPNPGEYVVLVISKTPQTQELVRQTLPRNTNTNVCKHSDNLVTRIGGFTAAQAARDWMQYLNDIVGLQALVMEPPVVVEATAVPSSEAIAPTRTQTTQETVVAEKLPVYNPQQLGTGYAILVDYFNRPEIAQQVQQLVGKEVGLVSFGQRPYLLVLHTTNESNATNTFQMLNERGFVAVMADGRKVTVLRSQVLNQPSSNGNRN
jgi:hypothetical protein